MKDKYYGSISGESANMRAERQQRLKEARRRYAEMHGEKYREPADDDCRRDRRSKEWAVQVY